MAKRIILFILVNILVMVTISIITSVLGVNHYMTARGINYSSLLVFCFIWGFGGAFISLAISRWIAKFSMNITPIDPNNCNIKEKDLYNRVASLAQKAGLPATPEVGIFESSDLNAFATGPSKKRSLVAVSSGLLENMDNHEIDGVLAHEISHIANGDMVTMTLIQGVVNAFVMFFARIIAFATTQFVKEDIRPIVNLIVIIVLEILFSILGSIVIAWFSRQREFKADSGGARLAGKNNMISALNALKRVYDKPLEEGEKAPQALAAFQISNKSSFLELFSTHPPLDVRIQALKQNNQIL
ncbi:protease HtpX [Fluviispira multicolorata]|uniref:Protease HtpX homolog n=1 Tax=Fluviispira multicolorata TaxID=2654512 RepID=A0A833JBB2_9BACT|nr:protease HtpX [Fluviispira multicolorata]KAB8029162.1 protease HtpX [Fluviispira multicolorata]